MLQQRRQDQELYADGERKFVSNSERAITPNEQASAYAPAMPGAFSFSKIYAFKIEGSASIGEVFCGMIFSGLALREG
jgi:hypothetical protein